MDQLKTFVRQLVRYHFWVLSGVVTLFGLLIWYLAYAKLTEDYKKQETVINGAYGNLESVSSVVNHPNQHSEKKMKESASKTRVSVNQAWTTQYQNQLSVLKWPVEVLEKDFVRAVEPLRPIESIGYPTDPSKEIRVDLRGIYRDYVKEVLPKLATIIDAQWYTSAGGGSLPGGAGAGFGGAGFGGAPGAGNAGAGGFGGARSENADGDKRFVVDWNPQNQSRIAARFDWTKQKDEVPKTLQILYAQEDYWVLDALLNIIKNTNENADARYKAAVKSIDSIELGADVSGLGGQVTRLSGSSGGGMPQMGGAPNGEAGRGPPMSGGASGPPGLAGMGGAAGMPGGLGGMGSNEQKDPAEYRYVDYELKPVDAKRLRDAVTQENPKDAFLAVAKRMPVRLRVKMDLRKLNKLLAECGNSSLPVEIRQVRINKQAAGNAMMGGGGGGGGGGMNSGPGMGAPSGLGAGADAGGAGMGGMRGGGGGRGGGNSQLKEPETYDGEVELFGLVYLFNPPLRGVQIGAENLPAVGGNPATPPATTTGVSAPNNVNTKS